MLGKPERHIIVLMYLIPEQVSVSSGPGQMVEPRPEDYYSSLEWALPRVFNSWHLSLPLSFKKSIYLLFICVCTCVSLCIYVCLCMCVYMCTCVWVHVWVSLGVYVSVCACVCVYICVHVCECTCASLCVYVCLCMCVHVCTYVWVGAHGGQRVTLGAGSCLPFCR